MTAVDAPPPTLREICGDLDEARAKAALAQRESEGQPWFMRALVGAATWIGASILTGGIMLASQGGSVLGLGLIAAAAWIRRAWRDDKATQATLALSFAGHALFLMAIVQEVRGDDWKTMWTAFIALQAVVIVAIPDATHRFISALAAAIAAAILSDILQVEGGVDCVALACGVLVMAGFYLDAQAAARGWGPIVRPVAYGLAAAFLGILCFQASVQLGGHSTWLGVPGTTSVGVGVLCVALVGLASGEVGRPTLAGASLVGLSGALVVAAAMKSIPALPASLLVLGLGRLRGERALLVMGQVGLSVALGYFFFTMEISLLSRSLALAGSGAALLAVWRLALRPAREAPAESTPRRRLSRAEIAVCAAALFAVGGPMILVARSELLLARGRPVFLAVQASFDHVPVLGGMLDLEYPLVADIIAAGPKGDGCAVLRLDARGVGTFARLDDGRPLGADEVRLRFQLRGEDQGADRLKFAAGTWSVPEGARSLAVAARFTEMRVSESGKALIAGIRDEGMAPIGR